MSCEIKYVKDGQRLDTANKERKVCGMEIEINTVFVKGDDRP